MVLPDSSTATTVALAGIIVVVLLAAGKAVSDEVSGGTDSLSLASTVLLVSGSVVSIGSQIVGLDDESQLFLASLVVVSLGFLLRGVVWFRDREQNATSP